MCDFCKPIDGGEGAFSASWGMGRPLGREWGSRVSPGSRRPEGREENVIWREVGRFVCRRGDDEAVSGPVGSKTAKYLFPGHSDGYKIHCWKTD